MVDYLPTPAHSPATEVNRRGTRDVLHILDFQGKQLVGTLKENKTLTIIYHLRKTLPLTGSQATNSVRMRAGNIRHRPLVTSSVSRRFFCGELHVK